MEQYNNNYQQEHEFGWEDEIVQDAQEFILLPDGDYDFKVENVERARFNGSEKMPPCNMAKVKLVFETPQGLAYITHQLMLHSKVEWKLAEFFASIGLKKKGQPLRMTWNIGGYKGKCKIGHREYNGNTYNEIKKFYSAEEQQGSAVTSNQQQYAQSQSQQTYGQQPQYTPGKW